MVNFCGKNGTISFLVKLIDHVYVFLKVEFACRVYIGKASVNALQIILNFHEVFVAQMYSIHDIIHIFIMSKFLLYERLLLDMPL